MIPEISGSIPPFVLRGGGVLLMLQHMNARFVFCSFVHFLYAVALLCVQRRGGWGGKGIVTRQWPPTHLDKNETFFAAV